MNHENLTRIVEQYVSRFDELNSRDGGDEGYKWRAETCFKRHWDIDAADFPEMFKLTLSETSNLIDNKTVQPIGGISNLLKNADEVEFVRGCFCELFSEDYGDLAARQERIETFMGIINSRIDQYTPGSWKYPQAFNHVLYYLNLWRPEENYIYKATEAAAWADCIGFGDDFGSGTTFSLARYYKMCDELREELPRYEELMQRHNERFAREANGFDDKLHILVYDIIYCSYRYGFYTGMYIPKMSTKDRIKASKTQAKREELQRQIQAKKAELQTLEQNPVVLPDLTGHAVTHRTFGDGTVVSCGDGMILADFAGQQKKFMYPDAFKQSFLICEDEAVGKLFQAAAEYDAQVDALKSEIAKLQADFRNLA